MRSRVNQKLYYARLVLDQAASVTDASARQALLDGALLHLHTAYRAYLNEIAASYQQTIEADSAAAALQQMQSGGHACPELGELAALEQGGHWPARLRSAWLDATAIATAPQPAAAAGAIAVADITRSVDVDDCRHWLAAFQALLDVQRERLQEW
jgi:hypothetical protein